MSYLQSHQSQRLVYRCLNPHLRKSFHHLRSISTPRRNAPSHSVGKHDMTRVVEVCMAIRCLDSEGVFLQGSDAIW